MNELKKIKSKLFFNNLLTLKKLEKKVCACLRVNKILRIFSLTSKVRNIFSFNLRS